MKRSATQIINDNDVLILDDDIFMMDNIGNRRFIVIIGMFRRKYLEAIYRGDKDESEQIVKNIVDSICNKAVPNGHFFQCDKKRRGWYDIGNGELVYQKVRISLLDNISRIQGSNNVPSLSTMKANKPAGKNYYSNGRPDNYSDNQNEKEAINLGDRRFEVKDPLLLDSMSNLTRRRIITAKIRRNHNKKAVIKDNVNYYSSTKKANKNLIKSKTTEKASKGTKKRTLANKITNEKVSRAKHESMINPSSHHQDQLHLHLIDETSHFAIIDERHKYNDHIDIHDEIGEILAENNSSMTFDLDHIFSDDEEE